MVRAGVSLDAPRSDGRDERIPLELMGGAFDLYGQIAEAKRTDVEVKKQLRITYMADTFLVGL